MAIFRGIWLFLAVLMAVVPVQGDSAILVGWLFLLWTFPFSGIWWFYLSHAAQPFLTPAIDNLLGSAFAIIAAYCFWLFLVPALMRWAGRRGRNARAVAR
jgi:hypothetical protein